ncbi:MAG: hypothetical protein ACFB0G_14410 [Leptolyngbyaceae cyanobacterium]
MFSVLQFKNFFVGISRAGEVLLKKPVQRLRAIVQEATAAIFPVKNQDFKTYHNNGIGNDILLSWHGLSSFSIEFLSCLPQLREWFLSAGKGPLQAETLRSLPKLGPQNPVTGCCDFLTIV